MTSADTPSAAQRPLFSLAHLTTLSLTPPDMIAVAANAGYDAVGLRLLPVAPGGVAYALQTDATMRRETLARIADTGVQVYDIEIVRLGSDFDVQSYTAFFDVGQEIGARAILIGCDDRNADRLAQSFAAFCEAAASYGLTANIEFMPWTTVPDAASAKRLYEAAGRPPNGGILVDPLHFARSTTTLDDIRSLPREALHYMQMCDASADVPTTNEALIHTARSERLLPGEGGIDLAGLCAALPSGLPIGLEIPNEKRATALGPQAWAKQALEATKRVFAAQPFS